VENMSIRELMSPVNDFPRISSEATFNDTLMALEKSQEEFKAGKSRQRILLVEDQRGTVLGKVSPMDLMKGLEASYEKIEKPETIYRWGLGYALETMKEEFRLWQKPLADLCRKAEELKVESFATKPTKGHKVDIDDTMDSAFHFFVMARHDSLFVMEKDKILGLLRFSDVYKKIAQEIKKCVLTS